MLFFRNLWEDIEKQNVLKSIGVFGPSGRRGADDVFTEADGSMERTNEQNQELVL